MKLKDIFEWMDFNKNNDVVKRNAPSVYHLHDEAPELANWAGVADGKIIFKNKTKEQAKSIANTSIIKTKYKNLQIKQIK